jgi:hypothetical protein
MLLQISGVGISIMLADMHLSKEANCHNILTHFIEGLLSFLCATNNTIPAQYERTATRNIK